MAAGRDGILRCDNPGCGREIGRVAYGFGVGVYCSEACKAKAATRPVTEIPLRDRPPRSERGAPAGPGGADRPGNNIPRIFALADSGVSEVERCREWIAAWMQAGRPYPGDEHFAAAQRCLEIDTDIQWQINAYEILRRKEVRSGQLIPVEEDFWSDAYPGMMFGSADTRNEEILRAAGGLMLALLAFLLLLAVSVALTFWWAGRL